MQMRLQYTEIVYKIYYFLFLALAVAFPIHDKLAPPIISLIGINWILQFNFRQKYRKIRSMAGSKHLLSFALLYIFYMIGTLYSDNLHGQSGALFNLEVKMSLWVFPLLFTTVDFERFGAGFKKQMLYAFLLGCLISVILIFNKAVFSYFQTGSTDVFYYIKLAEPQHPSYLSLFLVFAIAVLLVWNSTHFDEKALKRNASIVLILLFHVFIVLLSSKAGILSTGLIYVAAIAYHFLVKEPGRKKNILLPAILLVLFMVTLSFFPLSYSRFYAAESAIENEPDASSLDGSVARVLVWETSLEIIRAHPLFGVGTGDVQPELMHLYKEKNIQLGMEESLNAHNQYLQTAIALGLIGFLLLVSYFVFPVIFAFRNRHLLYLLFLILFAFHMLVESMLERQAGVVFYGLMNSFLFYYALGSDRESEHKLP